MMRRKRARGPWRYIWIPIVLVWVVPRVFAALATTATAIVAIPVALVASVVAIVALVAVLAVALAVAAGAIALPAWFVWRVTRPARDRRDAPASEPEPDADREATRLRRSYVAGILTDTQFRDAMLTNLKQRFANGSLDISEYEAEVARLVRASTDATPLRELRRSSQRPKSPP